MIRVPQRRTKWAIQGNILNLSLGFGSSPKIVYKKEGGKKKRKEELGIHVDVKRGERSCTLQTGLGGLFLFAAVYRIPLLVQPARWRVSHSLKDKTVHLQAAGLVIPGCCHESVFSFEEG